jgi:hypothetical protein
MQGVLFDISLCQLGQGMRKKFEKKCNYIHLDDRIAQVFRGAISRIKKTRVSYLGYSPNVRILLGSQLKIPYQQISKITKEASQSNFFRESFLNFLLSITGSHPALRVYVTFHRKNIDYQFHTPWAQVIP